MATDNELQRLAMMANALRPEWPVRSLLTRLTTTHAARPYRDLAVALAWIATDPATKTPARLAEAGPWWHATSMTESVAAHIAPAMCADHPDQKAAHCVECASLAVPKPEYVVIPRPQKRAFVPEARHHENSPGASAEARITKGSSA